MIRKFIGMVGVLALVGGVVDAAEKKPARVDFVKQIKPILEYNCVACHREGYAEKQGGGYQLDVKEKALKGRRIKPGDHESSSVWESMTLPLDDEEVMPPKEKDQRPTKEEIALVALWIDQGAAWPDGLMLKPKKKIVKGEDEEKIVGAIFRKIMAGQKPVKEADMKPYNMKISQTLASFDMVPIKGGEFLMGSPSSEKGRSPDEGPQRRVRLSPFWMGKHEVTWSEFSKFEDHARNEKLKKGADQYYLDATAIPTRPYVNMDFGMGKGDRPAISITHHGASKYCQWLSIKTGQFYRLPTEAEWEYACRAGTSTPFSWGDKGDSKTLNDQTWNVKNSINLINFRYEYQKVGKKPANPWGLHDMHGNVAEWVLDGYAPYKPAKGVLVDPWVRGTKPYPHVARGGAFSELIPLTKLRSAARIYSGPTWKQQDPQIPKSIWWLTDAQFLGFRIVRPLKVPTEAEMKVYWNNGVEYDTPID